MVNWTAAHEAASRGGWCLLALWDRGSWWWFAGARRRANDKWHADVKRQCDRWWQRSFDYRGTDHGHTGLSDASSFDAHPEASTCQPERG